MYVYICVQHCVYHGDARCCHTKPRNWQGLEEIRKRKQGFNFCHISLYFGIIINQQKKLQIRKMILHGPRATALSLCG